MKTAIFEKAGLMTIEEVPKPQLQADDDVIIKVVRACVCGSDLWAYANGDKKAAHSVNSGHEALGIVEEVGPAITTVQPGDFVIYHVRLFHADVFFLLASPNHRTQQ